MKFVLFTFTLVPALYFYFLLFYFILKSYFYFCPFIFSKIAFFQVNQIKFDKKQSQNFLKFKGEFYSTKKFMGTILKLSINLVWFLKIYFLLYTFESKSTNVLLYFYFYLEVNSTILLLCTFYFKVTFSLLCPSLERAKNVIFLTCFTLFIFKDFLLLGGFSHD